MISLAGANVKKGGIWKDKSGARQTSRRAPEVLRPFHETRGVEAGIHRVDVLLVEALLRETEGFTKTIRVE